MPFASRVNTLASTIDPGYVLCFRGGDDRVWCRAKLDRLLISVLWDPGYVLLLSIKVLADATGASRRRGREVVAIGQPHHIRRWSYPSRDQDLSQGKTSKPLKASRTPTSGQDPTSWWHYRRADTNCRTSPPWTYLDILKIAIRATSLNSLLLELTTEFRPVPALPTGAALGDSIDWRQDNPKQRGGCDQAKGPGSRCDLSAKSLWKDYRLNRTPRKV